jgi:alpha-1,2-mannosyltransferase
MAGAAATAISALVFCLVSAGLFGWQTWRDFLAAAATSGNVYASGRIPFSGFVTPFGGAMLLGAGAAAAAVLQAVASATAAGVVAYVWRRNPPLPIRAACLVSATLVAVPLALFYDLVLAGVAGAWLLRADGEYRLPEWGKLILAGLYVLCLNPRGIAAAWRLPVGPIVTMALTALSAWLTMRVVAPTPARRRPVQLSAGTT